jgi:hypothetical protein
MQQNMAIVDRLDIVFPFLILAFFGRPDSTVRVLAKHRAGQSRGRRGRYQLLLSGELTERILKIRRRLLIIASAGLSPVRHHRA